MNLFARLLMKMIRKTAIIEPNDTDATVAAAEAMYDDKPPSVFVNSPGGREPRLV